MFVLIGLNSCNNSAFKTPATTEQTNNSEQTLSGQASVAPPKLTPEAYVSWIESDANGLKVRKKIGDFTFAIFYKPLAYLALSELNKDSTTETNLQKKIKEYEGLQYFSFRISAEKQQKELLKVNLKSDEEYYSRIEYLSFTMQNDLKLIEGKDTLNCVLYHFERVYGLAPFATFVLGFPLTEREEKSPSNKFFTDKTFLYEDNVFGSGNIYMNIKKESLNRIPELIIN